MQGTKKKDQIELYIHQMVLKTRQGNTATWEYICAQAKIWFRRQSKACEPYSPGFHRWNTYWLSSTLVPTRTWKIVWLIGQSIVSNFWYEEELLPIAALFFWNIIFFFWSGDEIWQTKLQKQGKTIDIYVCIEY